MQRSSKALTLVALLAAVALHSCAPVRGFLGLAPVSSGLRSVLPTRARLLARAAEADGEDGDSATWKKPLTQQERLLKVLDEKKLATGDVTDSVYEQAPEKKVSAAAVLKQQRMEAIQTLVAAMPDVKAEDLEVGQVVKGILRQSKDIGQVVSLGKELSGILLWIEAAEDGRRKESFRGGVEQEFRVLAKTTAFGDGLPVLLTARSGDLTRPPSMVEDILFASPQEAATKRQDLSEFAGISPKTWLEATVVNTAVRKQSLPPRVIVTLTAPGGSKKVVQSMFEKALPGSVSFGSKLKVRAVVVDLAKSRLGLTMLEKTPEETKA